MTEHLTGPPSPRLMKWADMIAADAPGLILDAPCGKGRNAVPFAARGCDVLCADRDGASLSAIASYGRDPRITGTLRPVEVDLLGALPFVQGSLGAVINVHFFTPSLSLRLASLVRSGGFVYVESPENRGGNYHQLPRAGEVRALLGTYEVLSYLEKKAGPPSVDAVTFSCLVRRR